MLRKLFTKTSSSYAPSPEVKAYADGILDGWIGRDVLTRPYQDDPFLRGVYERGHKDGCGGRIDYEMG
jgi:hypothetical protein